ncbi:MAG: ABC transporter permease [Abditibacteriota bacterium]|nr:ABC transporter permease [Abditibacteriota bacterium]
MASEKPIIQRQTKLPLKTAFDITMSGMKTRFWRSMITAAGVTLGIAFLTMVFINSLMDWPKPIRIEDGYVRIDGQINKNGFYGAYKSVPVDTVRSFGLIPEAVIQDCLADNGYVDLTKVYNGRYMYDHSQEMIDMRKEELAGLEKIDKKFYDTSEVDVSINKRTARKNGVPEGIIKILLPKGSKSFKASQLAAEVQNTPLKIKFWERQRVKYSMYKDIDKQKLTDFCTKNAYSVDEIIERASGLDEATADKRDVKIVKLGLDGQKNKRDSVSVDQKDKNYNGSKKHVETGDYIVISDITATYRSIWLAVMSLLVCAVGITNSMLMSVTERFKEIGTMKCLGALDSFIVTIFVLESAVMGIAASFIGFIAGFIISVCSNAADKGWKYVFAMNPVDVLQIFGLAIAAGLVLTFFASIPPARKAATMPAAIALRSEI